MLVAPADLLRKLVEGLVTASSERVHVERAMWRNWTLRWEFGIKITDRWN